MPANKPTKSPKFSPEVIALAEQIDPKISCPKVQVPARAPKHQAQDPNPAPASESQDLAPAPEPQDLAPAPEPQDLAPAPAPAAPAAPAPIKPLFSEVASSKALPDSKTVTVSDTDYLEEVHAITQKLSLAELEKVHEQIIKYIQQKREKIAEELEAAKKEAEVANKRAIKLMQDLGRRSINTLPSSQLAVASFAPSQVHKKTASSAAEETAEVPRTMNYKKVCYKFDKCINDHCRSFREHPTEKEYVLYMTENWPNWRSKACNREVCTSPLTCHGWHPGQLFFE